ncbi:carbohydrate kinase [Acaricomes phytoseiuli]|uniref:carbohydrate kinase family protein n=1 Tax=Acaricomes phytoseiuli TaxID=291968 RepID=UPI000367CA46|nr:carbohydrate kinase [Acaricomes phytoseiuli]MCW1249707.1 carbohydrate kinase [Acaricomes phytoseiuli]
MLTVIGEALIDEVRRPGGEPIPHVGGSPMNVAVGLARLGLAVEFLGRYGQDDYGQLIEAHLRENSVLMPLPPDHLPTSIAAAELAEDGSATYRFDLAWQLPELEPERFQATTLLHTGSIAAMLDPGAATVHGAVLAARGHALISYDPNCRPSIVADRELARERAEYFVRIADIVKASDEDLAWLYPDREPEATAEAWLKLPEGPAMVVLTRGAQGPWGVAAAGVAEVPAPRVDVADTVGAGDSFMSALLFAITERGLSGAQHRQRLRRISREELTEMLDYAAAAAAITVSRPGADPPRRAELTARTSLH